MYYIDVLMLHLTDCDQIYVLYIGRACMFYDQCGESSVNMAVLDSVEAMEAKTQGGQLVDITYISV